MLVNSSGYRLKAWEAGYCLHWGSWLMAESNDGRIVRAHWVMKNLEPHLQTEPVIADVTVDLLAALSDYLVVFEVVLQLYLDEKARLMVL